MASRLLINAVWLLSLIFGTATAVAEDRDEMLEIEVQEKLTYKPLEISISQNTGSADEAEMAEPAKALDGFVAKQIKSDGTEFLWSPDGRYLYGSDTQVRLIEYPGFRQVRTTNLQGTLSFCSRGLCVYEHRGAVAVLDHVTLERKLGWAFPDPFASFHTSPGSRYAICSMYNGKGKLQIVNLSRGRLSKPFAPLQKTEIDAKSFRLNVSENLEYLSFGSDGKYLFAKAATRLFRFRLEDDLPTLDYASKISVLKTTQHKLQFSDDGRYLIVPTLSRVVRGTGDWPIVAMVPVDAPEVPDRIVDLPKTSLHQCGIDGSGNLFTIHGSHLWMFPADSDEPQPAAKLVDPFRMQLAPHPTQSGAVVYDRSRSTALWVAPANAETKVPTGRWFPERGRDQERR